MPKQVVLEVMDYLAGVVAHAPVGIGDVIVSNVLGTGSNIVATREAQRTA